MWARENIAYLQGGRSKPLLQPTCCKSGAAATRMRSSLTSLPLLLLLLAAPALAGPAVSRLPVHLPVLPLGVVDFPNGKAVNLTVSLGPGAFHQPGDAAGRLWVVTDRGPAFACPDTGGPGAGFCGPGQKGTLYVVPAFAPTIYGLDIDPRGKASLAVTLPLRGRSGRPVTGIASPAAAGAPAGFDPEGKALAANPPGLDPRSLVRLSDGSFWLADAYGPSLVHVGPDGTILLRCVPHGMAGLLAGADYPVAETLPEILSRGRASGGFGGLALSPDEKTLFAVMRGALAAPDAGTDTGTGRRLRSRTLRLLTVATANAAVTGEYAYRIDAAPPAGADAAGPPAPERRPAGVTALVALPSGRLLALEHQRGHDRLFLLRPDPARMLPAAVDDPATVPALEELSPLGLKAAGFTPLAKAPLAAGALPQGIAGLARLSEHALVAVIANDFGIAGGESRMIRLDFARPVLK